LDVARRFLIKFADCFPGGAADILEFFPAFNQGAFNRFCVIDPRDNTYCYIKYVNVSATDPKFCDTLEFLGCCGGTGVKILEFQGQNSTRDQYLAGYTACGLPAPTECPPRGVVTKFVKARWRIANFNFTKYLLNKAGVEKAFRADVAASLNKALNGTNVTVNAGQITVTSVTEGSLIVNFQVLGSNADTLTTPLTTATAAPVLTSLAAQDTGSTLSVDQSQSTATTATDNGSPASRAVPYMATFLLAALVALCAMIWA
jgi:hypothetical protein